ncbi:MAG: hypothetical protein JO247_21265 [Chloroflexi bacterium]|nr:hypothetical protein [Chloroflexota bacterium]
MQLTRRAALRLIFNGAAGALLAGCGSTAASSPAPVTSAPSSARPTGPASSVGAAGGATVQPASAAAAAKPPAPPASSLESAPPKAGGTLRIGQVGDIPTLDGHSATGLVAQTVALAYDKVLGYDDKLQPIGVLAESWDLAPDYKSIKLSLRKGVTFHNGREFTADDLKYNLLRVRMPAVAAQAAGLALQSAWFTGIDTPDKSTVVLTSDKPRLGTYDFLTGLNILDKDVMEGPDAKTKINGTGPFKFGE